MVQQLLRLGVSPSVPPVVCTLSDVPTGCIPIFPAIYQPSITLPGVRHNNPSATAGFPGRTIQPQDVSDVHHLIQCDTSGGVDKLERGVHIVLPPSYLLVSVIEIHSGFACGEGGLGAPVGGRQMLA